MKLMVTSAKDTPVERPSTVENRGAGYFAISGSSSGVGTGGRLALHCFASSKASMDIRDIHRWIPHGLTVPWSRILHRTLQPPAWCREAAHGQHSR